MFIVNIIIINKTLKIFISLLKFSMLLFLLIPMLFSASSELFLTMENRKNYCFYKILNKTETLQITYIVSGSGEKNVAFKV